MAGISDSGFLQWIPIIFVIFLVEGLAYGAMNGQAIANTFPPWSPPEPIAGWTTTNGTAINCNQFYGADRIACINNRTADSSNNPLDAIWYALSYVFSILSYIVSTFVAVIALVGAAMFGVNIGLTLVNVVLLLVLGIGIIRVFMP